MAYALGLPDALSRRGLTVEVVPGWETRSAGSFAPRGAVCHWTAGPRGTTRRASLAICTNGRPGLDGPLCNVYGARDGVAVVVAAGRANHAGVGSWRGVTGNSSFFGTEMEAADATDFTTAQRWSYPRINASFCDLGGFDEQMVCGHSEYATPAGRKQDVNHYPMSQLRADTGALLRPSAAALREDLVKHLLIARDMTTDPKITRVYVGDGISRRFIPDNQALKDLQWWITRKGGDPTVHEFANIWVLGDLTS